jgi:archaetidylinositol phosphate synthase
MLSRVHQSWLGPLERPLLAWLAERLPAAVAPDDLTVLGGLGALFCGFSYWATTLSPNFLWLASAGLILNWLGDSLDGTLARCRGIERPRYGFFVDHTTDAISQLLIILGLGASPYIRFDTACLALISYWIAALFTFIRALATQILQISYHGIGPTEARLGLIGYNFYLILAGPASFATRFGPMTPLDVFAILGFIVTLASFLAMGWSEGRRLASEDLIPPRPAAMDDLERHGNPLRNRFL